MAKLCEIRVTQQALCHHRGLGPLGSTGAVLILVLRYCRVSCGNKSETGRSSMLQVPAISE